MSVTIFISYASEDKDAVARPLAEALQECGYDVWFDEFSLELGDSLRVSIDEGLAKCAFGVVVLSKHFFAKDWPQIELDGLLAAPDGHRKIILPIVHELTHKEVARYSPILAGRLYANFKGEIDQVVKRIKRSVARETYRLVSGIGEAITRYLLTVEVPGTLFEEYLLTSFCDTTGIDPATIDSTTIMLAEDFSTIDSLESYINFVDGSRLQLDYYMHEVYSFRPAAINGEYQMVSWDVPDLLRNEDSFELAKHTLYVHYARRCDEILSFDDCRKYILALHEFAYRYEWFDEDEFWTRPASPGRGAVRFAINAGCYSGLEALLHDENEDAPRVHFLFSRAIVEELREPPPKEAEQLVTRLLQRRSPLGSHWKGELRKKTQMGTKKTDD